MDFDKSRCSHISVSQFSRVFKKLGIYPPSDSLFELITRCYFDMGNTKDANYVRFCKDVDRPEDMFPGYVPKKPLPPLVVKDP